MVYLIFALHCVFQGSITAENTGGAAAAATAAAAAATAAAATN